MACKTCPFIDEMVVNYGCLPAPYEILQMKIQSGHNWECHSIEGTKCKGFQENAKLFWPDIDIDFEQGNIISYETWNSKGLEEAIKEADERGNNNA